MQVLPSLFAYSLNTHVHISSAQAERSSEYCQKPGEVGGRSEGRRGWWITVINITFLLVTGTPGWRSHIVSWFFNNFIEMYWLRGAPCIWYVHFYEVGHLQNSHDTAAAAEEIDWSITSQSLLASLCFCLFVFMVKILAMRPALFIHSKVHTL